MAGAHRIENLFDHLFFKRDIYNSFREKGPPPPLGGERARLRSDITKENGQSKGTV